MTWLLWPIGFWLGLVALILWAGWNWQRDCPHREEAPDDDHDDDQA